MRLFCLPGQVEEEENREEMEGEEGVGFIAHVPVPSQKEVRPPVHSEVLIWVPVLTGPVCLRWRRRWSGGRRWSSCSATPARRFRLKARRPELCWDFDPVLIQLVLTCLCKYSVLYDVFLFSH